MLERYDIQGRVAVFIDAANVFYSSKAAASGGGSLTALPVYSYNDIAPA